MSLTLSQINCHMSKKFVFPTTGIRAKIRVWVRTMAGEEAKVWNWEVWRQRFWFLEDADWELSLWEETSTPFVGNEGGQYGRCWFEPVRLIGFGDFSIDSIKVKYTQRYQGKDYCRYYEELA